jgi:hypothetical protein
MDSHQLVESGLQQSLRPSHGLSDELDTTDKGKFEQGPVVEDGAISDDAHLIRYINIYI